MNFDRIRELVWEQTFQSSKLSSVLVMLEEVGKFISGRTPKSDELASIGDIPYFKVGDMNTEGNEKVLRITSLFLKEKAGKTFPAGAIVYPKNGGAVFTNKRRILATESVIDLNTGGFVCGERLNQAYTYMFFCGLDFRKISKGTALPTIDQKKLHQTKIPVPSLEEQSRIVTRLGEAFAEIDRAEKAYGELQTLAGVLRGQIFQEAIEGKLVPQLAEEGVVEQIGAAPEEVPFEIPEKWKWYYLGSVIEYGKSNQVSGDEITSQTWVLDLEDIEKNTGRILEKKRGVPSTSNKNKFESGYVLYSKLRPYLNKVVVADEAGVCTTEIVPVNVNGASVPLDAKYLQTYLMSPFFVNYANQASYGVKMPRLGTKDARAALIPIPPLEEQKRIVQKVVELLSQTDSLAGC